MYKPVYLAINHLNQHSIHKIEQVRVTIIIYIQKGHRRYETLRGIHLCCKVFKSNRVSPQHCKIKYTYLLRILYFCKDASPSAVISQMAEPRRLDLHGLFNHMYELA
jgi:hypothetical protein